MTDKWNDPKIRKAMDLIAADRSDGLTAEEQAQQRQFDQALEKADKAAAAEQQADLERLNELWRGRIPIGATANGGERANPHPPGSHAWREWDMNELGY